MCVSFFDINMAVETLILMPTINTSLVLAKRYQFFMIDQLNIIFYKYIILLYFFGKLTMLGVILAIFLYLIILFYVFKNYISSSFAFNFYSNDLFIH